ncbi:hypothetical protein HMPREF0294_1072 [Corynebacterium glucuronolyticum ATCC 51867]|uniref:Uncharacterized protein n=1 Tax=Corynebacterium glucuronolyticum ATCC 51866 TaxID=548478 RepID=A0ABM9XNJ3_9CORY|nr:hypothetical protein HMPREF0294_1072 [Corynebacterium glucuronolyticum ATCC 51867]EEI62734.1 hypothetical protein HMPREF0293_1883 [Corynebacterium glucuronolyticum ATCC 51866]
MIGETECYGGQLWRTIMADICDGMSHAGSPYPASPTQVFGLIG